MIRRLDILQKIRIFITQNYIITQMNKNNLFTNLVSGVQGLLDRLFQPSGNNIPTDVKPIYIPVKVRAYKKGI